MLQLLFSEGHKVIGIKILYLLNFRDIINLEDVISPNMVCGFDEFFALRKCLMSGMSEDIFNMWRICLVHAKKLDDFVKLEEYKMLFISNFSSLENTNSYHDFHCLGMFEKSIYISPIDEIFADPYNLPIITSKLNKLPIDCYKFLLLHKVLGPIRFKKYNLLLFINHNSKHFLSEKQFSIQTLFM